jgi:hypothetical protein
MWVLQWNCCALLEFINDVWERLLSIGGRDKLIFSCGLHIPGMTAASTFLDHDYSFAVWA